MRRDGLEPIQPHYPKIKRPYHLFDILLKISQLKMRVWSPENLLVGGGGEIMHNSQFLTHPHLAKSDFKFTHLGIKNVRITSLKRMFQRLRACRVFAILQRLQGWMGDCSRALVTTPLGPINSPRLLEHQVMAARALKLQPGLTALTLPQLELWTCRAHSWVP